jgi:hypothetical protein
MGTQWGAACWPAGGPLLPECPDHSMARPSWVLQGAMAQAADASVTMSVAVHGLGPVFRMAITLRNDGKASTPPLLRQQAHDGCRLLLCCCLFSHACPQEHRLPTVTLQP